MPYMEDCLDWPLSRVLPLLQQRIMEGRVRDVHVLGFVNQSELPRAYAAGDVLVVPSDRDPRATVVNETLMGSADISRCSKRSARTRKARA